MGVALSAHQTLERHGGAIASVVNRGRLTSGHAEVSVLKTSSCSVVMRVEINGKDGVAKVFGGRNGRASYERELLCLMALEEAELAPRLIKSIPQALCLVMKPVEGEPLRSALNPRNLSSYSRELGLWYRHFRETMPEERAGGNWWSYLKKVDGGGLVDALSDQRDFLRDLPLYRKSIARNDAHFSNFHITPQARLVGFDFEAAQVKPVGWDILLAARSLARMFPGQIENFLPALMDGWNQGNPNPGKRTLDARLVRIFAEATGFRG